MFWKIVAFCGDDSGLRASGYLMDQSHLIRDIPEEFAFGAFKTYQVSIARIARDAQLDLAALEQADVLRSFESLAVTPIARFADMVF